MPAIKSNMTEEKDTIASAAKGFRRLDSIEMDAATATAAKPSFTATAKKEVYGVDAGVGLPNLQKMLGPLGL